MTEEEKKRYCEQQIKLLTAIVDKLVLIEREQAASEKAIYNGITRTTNKMIQKMRTEIIREIRQPVKHSLWSRIKYKYSHYHNRLKRMFKR